MHDGLYAMFRDDSGNQCLVRNVALVKGNILWNGPAKAGGQVVDDDWTVACIYQGEKCMAADIAGATGDKNCTGCGHNFV